MSKTIELKEIAFYSDKRIHIDDVELKNFVSIDNILPNKLGIKQAVNLPQIEGNIPKFEEKNILIGNIRPYLKKIWFTNRDGGCTADVLTLAVKDGNCSKFVYYTLLRDDFFKHMMRGSKGTKMPRGDKNQIMDFTIPKFDLDKQQKIASILSTLDKKIELNNQINQKLEAMAKTLYDYWFVQFDFPDAEGKTYKSSGGKMVYNEELKREIPEGWEVRELSKIENNIVTGKTPPTKQPEYYNGDIPFISIGDIRGNMHVVSTESTLTEAGANNQAKKYIPKGSICVTCIASPGLIGFATEDSQTNQQINSIVCSQFENRFYLYFTLKDYFKFSSAKTGNTFANMNKQDFSEISLVYPANKILKRFSKILEPSIDKILNNSLETQKLTQLRDWLLPMLMNGQVKVGEHVNETDELMVAEPVVGYGGS